MADPLRGLVLAPFGPDAEVDDGGPRAQQVAQELAGSGLDVTVLVGAPAQTWAGYLGPVRLVRAQVVPRLSAAGATSGRGPAAVRSLLSWVPRGWRRTLPEVDDHEAVLGPRIDAEEPDVVVSVGAVAAAVAARAVGRAALRERRVAWVHVDTAPAGAHDAVRRRAEAAVRRELVRHADRVVDDPVAVVRALADVLGPRWDPVPPTGPAPRVVGVHPSATPAVTRSVDLPVTVGIGPANMAGQAWAWAKALERERPGTATDVLMVDRGSALVFPADELVPSGVFGRDLAWQQRMERRVLGTWTHALLESGRAVTGTLHGKDFRGDARILTEHGIPVALVLHGSELRDPRRHVLAEPWSPFRDATDPWVASVQATVDLLRPAIDDFDGPRLVSTPDLLLDLPDAVWLPVVVDPDVWRPGGPVLERDVPVVLHAPSRAAIKGTDHVEQALEPLVRAGRIEYRRVEGVSPDQVPHEVAAADVVLDQFAIGSYGVMACQAMAAGRVVVGHVSDQVREHVTAATGLELPLLEATPATLGAVLEQVLDDRAAAARSAAAGHEFALAVHGGARSAGVLADVLGLG